ncbi:MAG: BBP7 family outer membrane beta-barrel protein [Pirellulaceae bacterium]|jgi:hypothetical protein|nr:BBP7 family outer membrane beta-barrel protein [Pirellulaceae bacterium]
MMIAAANAHAQSYPYPSAPPQSPTDMAGGAMPYASPAPQYYPQFPPGYAPAGYMAPNSAPPGYAPVPPVYGYQPAGYYDVPQGAAPMPLAPSPAAPMPNGMEQGPVAMGEMPYEGSTGQTWCGNCGGYGCEHCLGGCDDFDLQLLRWLLPYGAGGCGAQRWYDASFEWVAMQRDDIGVPTVFSTLGVGGPAALGTDDLSFGDAPGLRASFALQLGAGNNIESTFIGLFNWSTQAEVQDNNNQLFSIISNYGQAPFLGFQDTDRAQVHRIEYSTELNSFDLNYRQRWVGPNVRVQGSWLAGVRYIDIREDFQYLTFAPANPGSMNYLVGTSNALTGGQVGGDLWICITPGVHIGAEAKLGLFGNHAVQNTVINASSFLEPLRERAVSNSTSFAGDFNVSLLWRMSQNWTLRTGYMFLWADSVAIATDNFNPEPPFVVGARTVSIDNDADVLYHGFTLGVEYLW